MSEPALPPLIDALVHAINAGDAEGVFSLFAPDAVVNDWGSEYTGLDQIRAWNDRELIGAKGVLTVRSVKQNGNRIALVTDWKSNFFSGPGRFEFTLDNGKIKQWTISEL
jgi:uncharacterized protein (TIGR02246 family)